MLNRRHLRVKALQSLYAYYRSGNENLANGEKELLHSAEKVMDLFLYQLSIFPAFIRIEERVLEERKKKLLATDADRNPDLKILNNDIIRILDENPNIERELEKRKISWARHQEILRKVWSEVKESGPYKEYMDSEEKSLNRDRQFVLEIFDHIIIGHELLEGIYEEFSIYWLDDFELVNNSVARFIRSINEKNGATLPLPSLFNDPEDDKKFMKDLFRLTILKNEEYEKLISRKTKNWEMERLAQMDSLILKMAVCELTNFPSIPVKVTMNEYIELSKYYSTPKSRIFVNGVLDKLSAELKESGKIKKAGRGLIE